MTWVGDQGSLRSVEKVVWDIQENFLIARRSYQRIRQSEPEGVARETETGAAIAMYRIESHFDIRREYDEVTGEERNVVVENSSDRPWYERLYLRVDWSENLITDWEFLTPAKLLGGLELEPVSYYVQDLQEGHPHRPKFERQPGSDEVYYIDIVNKMFARPDTVEVPEIEEGVPHCFFFHTSHIDCAPVEITVRNSFLKVDENRDYQPAVQTGDRMARAGFFNVERAGYDQHYGVVEPARYRFYVRRNLWRQNHRRAGDGELVRCTEKNEAEVCGSGGSVCDLDWARAHEERTADGELEGACTIPYRQREVRPVVYHVSSGFPQELFEHADRAVEQWNGAFSQTVGSLREIECLDQGGEATDCAAEREREDARGIFVLCHNPVADTDPDVCGEPGTIADLGDLRYSVIGWVNEPHLYSPLGYGPPSADPETGEIIAGSALLYGAAFERATSFGRDVLALLAGDLDEQEVREGRQVEAWVQRLQAPGSATTGRPADDHVVAIDASNLAEIDAAMDFSWARGMGIVGAASAAEATGFVNRIESVRAALARNGAFGGQGESGAAANLIDTDIERMLTNSEALLASGLDPGRPLNDEVLRRASPLRMGGWGGRARALERLRQQADEHGCVLTQQFADAGMMGLAREIQRAASEGDGTVTWYGKSYRIADEQGRVDYDAVRLALRALMATAISVHEIGHTLGLYHNFSGSYDALNYNRRYWELRDDGNMAPRAWDPLTDAEVDGRIDEYAYSSVMDYSQHAALGQGASGVGHYDVAAIKLGYGDLVEVFDEVEDATAVNLIGFLQRMGYPVQLTYSALAGAGSGFEVKAHNYLGIVTDVVGGIDRLEKRSDVPYRRLSPDPVLLAQDVADPAVDPEGRPAVPYRFCNDYLSEVRPECQRYDAGADAYESVQSIIDHYWNYHLFNAYRRERLGFEVEGYVEKIHGRYLAKLQRANQVYTLYRGIFEALFAGNPSLEQFWIRSDGMGDWTVAAGAAYQLLTRIITTPEAGYHQGATRGDGTEVLRPVTGWGSVRIDDYEGRPLETTWDIEAGYYSWENIERVGFYYDKVLALEALTDPRTFFIARDTAPDIRKYQISFYSSFGPAVTRFMRGLLSEDWQSIAPRYHEDAVQYPGVLDIEPASRPGTPIDPNTPFSIQLNAAVLSMTLFPETFDQGYFNCARIFLSGGAESVELDPELPTVSFTDPTSGLIYVAGSYLDDDGRETGIGARMLLHAQGLLENGAYEELSRFVDTVDLLRRLTWRLGYR